MLNAIFFFIVKIIFLLSDDKQTTNCRYTPPINGGGYRGDFQ